MAKVPLSQVTVFSEGTFDNVQTFVDIENNVAGFSITLRNFI